MVYRAAAAAVKFPSCRAKRGSADAGRGGQPGGNVTERLYYADSSLTTFTARVVAVRPVGERTGVVLDRTAFYPTSGGQPFDTGWLGGALVVEVIAEEEAIFHLVVGTPPDAGAVVTGQVDSERRRDHVQQHSGQHVLSAAFDRVAGLKTVSFHLGPESATIDLNVTRLAPEVVGAVEDLANAVVLEDRPVLVHLVASDDLARFNLRKPT